MTYKAYLVPEAGIFMEKQEKIRELKRNGFQSVIKVVFSFDFKNNVFCFIFLATFWQPNEKIIVYLHHKPKDK